MGAVGIEGVSRDFGAVRAVDDVSLEVRAGEFFTLLGPSGCGKTTLLRLVAGFEAPDRGRVTIGGADVTRLPPHRRRANTVFQSYALFPHLSVARNVAFGLEMLGRPRAEVTATVARMLALVRMEALAHRLPHELSGGQQQRVALARALAPAPEVLLLDEPLSALDLKLRREMQGELKRLQAETGITFVFVTHDQEEALALSDRVGVMEGGRLLQVGAPREVYDRPVSRFVATFVGESSFLPAIASGGRARLLTGEDVGDAPGEGPVTLAVRPEGVRVGPPGQGVAATVRGLTFTGADLMLDLVLGDGTPLAARVPAGLALQPGAAVGVALDARVLAP